MAVNTIVAKDQDYLKILQIKFWIRIFACNNTESHHWYRMHINNHEFLISKLISFIYCLNQKNVNHQYEIKTFELSEIKGCWEISGLYDWRISYVSNDYLSEN